VDRRPVAWRLAEERQGRPAAAPGAEAVLAALARAGVEVRAPTQALASVQRARFCVGGEAPGGLAVAVCEYASPEEAAAGRTYALTTFAAVPHREVLVRGSTTLTLRAPAAAPLTTEQGRKAAEAFAALPVP
jgi:hypothetical protein